MTGELQIIDCHQHFYDSHLMRYGVFTEPSAGFAAVVGDYAALPRVYRPEDYARDVAGLKVVGSVWAEFISGDPLEEARWAAALNRDVGQPSGLIALVEFADPDLDRLLDAYQTIGLVRCVRQHMGWHPNQQLLRFTPRSDQLADPVWRRGLYALRHRGLVCEIEIFSSQLRDFADLAAAFPDQQFVLPVMGWPIDLTNDGHLAWKRDFTIVAAHPNVALKIFGLECIFGVGWTTAQVRPWILDAIEIFGPNRCMFASHMPICTLACSFEQLYAAYGEIIDGFALTEKRQLMHDTAAELYRISQS
jgi:predicted TIM-barrel fold metal-dependent hydrolase